MYFFVDNWCRRYPICRSVGLKPLGYFLLLECFRYHSEKTFGIILSSLWKTKFHNHCETGPGFTLVRFSFRNRTWFLSPCFTICSTCNILLWSWLGCLIFKEIKIACDQFEDAKYEDGTWCLNEHEQDSRVRSYDTTHDSLTPTGTCSCICSSLHVSCNLELHVLFVS